MVDASSVKTDELGSLKVESDKQRDEAIVEWPFEGGKTIDVDGLGSVTLRTTHKPHIVDEPALLRHCVENLEKMPFSLKWDDKTLETLTEAGALPAKYIYIDKHHTIAVKLEE